ncbi:MAG: glycosyltransferase family 39 protein [Patescibacteria group bacterium]
MKKFLPIVLLTIISVFLIFYRFADIPKNLAFDEVEFTKLALSLNNKPYIPYSQLATGHSTLYFYILLASLKTFGINTFALRFPAAIFGILSVLLFYLIMKKVFKQSNNETMKQWLPFILSLILLSSRWFLNFSRFSFEATFLLFLELVSIYFLIKFNENQKAKIPFLRQSPGAPMGVWRSKKTVSCFYLIISGLFAGFTFLSYTPGRIFFLLPMGFLFLTMKQWNNETIKRILLFLIPFVITVTPLTSYLLTNKDIRIDQQFFLKNNEMTVNEKISGLWHNISSTALMFNIKGDVNGRHNYPNKPALNPILGILFIFGLIISIKNFNNLYNKLFLLYFLISIFPALMTYPWENPNMLRIYTVLPSVVYFVGNAIIILLTIVHKLVKNRGISKYLILITFYLILIFSCFYELRTYFKYQSIVFKQSFEIKLPLEKAIKFKFKP